MKLAALAALIGFVATLLWLAGAFYFGNVVFRLPLLSSIAFLPAQTIKDLLPPNTATDLLGGGQGSHHKLFFAFAVLVWWPAFWVLAWLGMRRLAQK